MEKYRVFGGWSRSIQKSLSLSFRSVSVLALDVGGKCLSRKGTVRVVQIATQDAIFLFDVRGCGRKSGVVVWLKGILESPDIEKVVHDCRMDSDALFHKLGISLVNVHDTSSWHEAITGEKYKGLRHCLQANRLNPLFLEKSKQQSCASGPCTKPWLEKAAKDVAHLLSLARSQKETATSEATRVGAESDSAKRLKIRDMFVGEVWPRNRGWFIGKKRRNLFSLEKKTNTYFSQNDNSGAVLVYYHQKKDFDVVANLGFSGGPRVIVSKRPKVVVSDKPRMIFVRQNSSEGSEDWEITKRRRERERREGEDRMILFGIWGVLVMALIILIVEHLRTSHS